MPLSIGAAREKITPKVGGFLFGYNNHTQSTSIHDDLTVTALAIKSETTTVVVLNATVCLIQNELCDEIRSKVGQKANIPPENVIISATHTHSGPRTTGYAQFKSFGTLDEEYCENVFIPKCLAASEAALSEMKPVKVGIGTTESKVGINRRQLLRDNTVTLGQNPWDTYDSTMTVITFANETGKSLANIVHVGAHPTAAGNNHEVTRDWPGVMVDRMEAETGGMTIFVNGTQGDIAPRMANGDSVGNLQHAMEVGGLAGIDAVRAYKSIRTFYDEPLSVVCGDIELPFKNPIPKDEVAKRLADNPKRFEKASLETLSAMHESGEMGPDAWNMQQTLVRLGPVVFVPFPFEVSSEIGLRLRAYSPFAHTLLLSCTNGSNSYLPTQSQLCRGGYEVDSFYWFRPRQLPDDTDQMMVDQNISLIEKIAPSY